MTWMGRASGRKCRSPWQVLGASLRTGNREMADLQAQGASGTARASLPPCLEESAGRTPASARPPLRSPAAQLQDCLLLAGCPALCLSSGMGPSRGKFSRVLWQPRSTRTLQGVVEKSEFDMLGNI